MLHIYSLFCPQEPQIRLQVGFVSWSNLWQRDSHPSGSSIVRSLALGVLSSPSCPHSFLPYLLLLLLLLLCLHLPLASCSSHARGIFCGIHPRCMRSPFHIAHAKWSLVFNPVLIFLYHAIFYLHIYLFYRVVINYFLYIYIYMHVDIHTINTILTLTKPYEAMK